MYMPLEEISTSVHVVKLVEISKNKIEQSKENNLHNGFTIQLTGGLRYENTHDDV